MPDILQTEESPDDARCRVCGCGIPASGICCPNCGAGRAAPTDEYCTACGSRIPAFGAFCPNCGVVKASLRMEPLGRGGAPPEYWARRSLEHAYAATSTPWRRMIKAGIAAGMLVFVVYLMVCIAALIAGIDTVVPELEERSYTFFIAIPFFIDIGSLSGGYLVAYYFALIVTILVSAAWLLLTGSRGFINEIRMKATPRAHSPLFAVCGVLFANLFISLAVVFILELFGGVPTSPVEEAEVWELLFLLANASVWEELIVRVLMIGLPLIFIDLARNKLRTQKSRYILGGGFSFGIPEIVLIILSSTIFGLAHYEGWGAWKIIPTAIGGVGLGYLFLKYGLAAAIMVHFSLDYLTMPIEVFDGLSSPGSLVLIGLGIMFWVALGAVLFGYYVIRIIEFLTGREFMNDKPAVFEPPGPVRIIHVPASRPASYEERQQAPSYQYGATRPIFVCSFCGHTEATWADGRFICARCGKS